MKWHTTVLLLACILITSCSPRYVNTVWKNDHAFPGKYNKIMVASIVNNQDTVLRKNIETHFIEALGSMGYVTVSALAEFGPYGLKDLDQEDSYIRLCNKGIDAIITIALLNKDRATGSESHQSYAQPVKYYYNRIWHYKELQGKEPLAASDSLMKYAWEMILFDLTTLQPHYIAQTKTIDGAIHQSMQDEFWNAFVKKLRNDRFLHSRPPLTNGPKVF
jgi:hypothetical protein